MSGNKLKEEDRMTALSTMKSVKKENGARDDDGRKSSKVAAVDAGKAKNGGLGSPASAAPPKSSSPASSEAHATSLLNLEVKVLTQPLGAENQWTEQGDGRVDFSDFFIRVLAPRAASDASSKGSPDPKATSGAKDGSAAGSAAPRLDMEGNPLSATVSDVAPDTGNDADEDEFCILEDKITPDTPFVGENCCIVWNSLDKQLSLCLMYASDEGYSASWSALVALQDKAYPPFRFDLLERCRPVSERPVNAEEGERAASSEGRDEEVVPYSYFLHNSYQPPLGTIEQHALSLSIVEHHHATNPALYANKETVLTLLSVATPDLLEHLISDDVFPMVLKGLAWSEEPPQWEVPTQLSDLTVPQDVVALINKDLRLYYLQNSVLKEEKAEATGKSSGEAPVDAFVDLRLKLTVLSQRLRNELTCTLLSTDVLFTQATEALRLAPPAGTANGAALGSGPHSAGAQRGRHSSLEPSTSSINSLVADPKALSSSSLPGAPGNGPQSSGPASPAVGSSLPADVLAMAQKAADQVLSHLRFLRNLVSFTVTELGRDAANANIIGPIIAKVFQGGLLEALSQVAERYAMPSGVAGTFLSGLGDASGHGSPHRRGGGPQNGAAAVAAGPNFYTPAIAVELSALLDLTLVRLNERQEETLMNDIVRKPVLADPAKYNGILTFMLRQLITGSPSVGAASSNLASLPSHKRVGSAPVSPFFSLSGTGWSRPGGAGPSSSPASPTARHMVKDFMSTANPFLLYHVLGLHDDEGTAAAERTLDPANTAIRNSFHHHIITKYISQATRGILAPVPLPPAMLGMAASKNAPIVQFSNIAGGSRNGTASSSPANGAIHASEIGEAGKPLGGAASPAGAGGNTAVNAAQILPQGISPTLLRLLEYLILLASPANREVLLKGIFNSKSHVLRFIEGVCEVLCCNGAGVAGGRCHVGLDVLCACVRFLKIVIQQLTPPAEEIEDNPIVAFGSQHSDPLPASLVTTVCRQLTVEHDTFGHLLKAFHAVGGTRRNTVFHSSVLSVLLMIARAGAMEADEPGANTLRDVRDYIFFKHLNVLPAPFMKRVWAAMLDDVTIRLGRESSRSPGESVSVLSSTTGSEMMRSSSKLRYVDELEAIAGGVDGTVTADSVVSPAMMASVASAEERQRKLSSRGSMEQWGALSSPGTLRPTASDGNIGSLASPHNVVTVHNGARGSPPPATASPSTISINRPTSTKTEKEGAASSASTEGGASNGVALKPTAPKNERPVTRPRSFASVLDGNNTDASVLPPPITSSNGTAGQSNGTIRKTSSGASTPPVSPLEPKANVRSPRTSLSLGADPGIMLDRPNGDAGGKQGITSSPVGSGSNLVLPKIKKKTSTSGKQR